MTSKNDFFGLFDLPNNSTYLLTASEASEAAEADPRPLHQRDEAICNDLDFQ